MELRPGGICRVLARELEAEVPARSYWAGPRGGPPIVLPGPCAGVVIELWSHPQFFEFGWARVITASGIGWASIEEIELEK
jgi:hypothetical protein